MYGDNSDKLIYEDEDIECFFVGNPRADGHMCISSINHYHIQLIPRYSYEKRGSKNFTKERHSYIYDEVKFNKVKEMIRSYVGE